MRQKPKPVKKDTIEIPKELISKNHNIDLCIDTMLSVSALSGNLSRLL